MLKGKESHPLVTMMNTPSALFFTSLVAPLAMANSTPNIILIMGDDIGYADYACFGHPTHQTPHIDKLVQGGVKLSDFHSNGVVSSPTRAALMTGLYQQRVGIEGVINAATDRDKGLAVGTTTLADMFKAHGYRTAIFGKWHLGYPVKHNPIHFGFDEFVGYISGNIKYFSHTDRVGNADWWHQDQLHPEEGYTTHLITQHAVEFIEKNKDKPFFLYIPHEAAHAPWQGPNDAADDAQASTGEKVSEKNQAIYKSMIEAYDEGVGKVYEAVCKAGIEENTLILLFSDNGGARLSLNAPFSGYKGNVLEGGHRVAALAYWKGVIQAGTHCHECITTLDILPTLCNLAGIDYSSKAHDGRNVWPCLKEGKALEKRYLFWRANAQALAVRYGDWKLVVRGKNRDTISLYNLAQDLGETKDIALQHPEQVQNMLAALRQWEASVDTDKPKR